MARKSNGGASGGDLVIASPLAGESTHDTSLVEGSVAYINTVYATKTLETARDIGTHLIDTYFGGDHAAFKAKGKSHVSFRQLAEHKDLRVKYGFLWNAVAVVEQLKLLPTDIAEALPFSHHKLLLPVKSEADKLKLAQEAVKSTLGKRDSRRRSKT
jgi:hypothetical protein